MKTILIIIGSLMVVTVAVGEFRPANAQNSEPRYQQQNQPSEGQGYQQTQRYDSGGPEPYQGPAYRAQDDRNSIAALNQAYRSGYRAGYWTARRGQQYDDHRHDRSEERSSGAYDGRQDDNQYRSDR